MSSSHELTESFLESRVVFNPDSVLPHLEFSIRSAGGECNFALADQWFGCFRKEAATTEEIVSLDEQKKKEMLQKALDHIKTYHPIF